MQSGKNNNNYKGAKISRIDGDIAYIELSNSEEFAIIDREDIKLIEDQSWRIMNNHDSRGYIGNLYAVGNGNLMHRVIMKAKYKQQLDHINGNGLDNRKTNLRFVTQTQNNLNCYKPHKKKDPSLPMGVRFNARNCSSRPYQAIMKVNKYPKYLGSFETVEEARKCFVENRIRVYGKEFAPNI
jgi:hypothetical protein